MPTVRRLATDDIVEAMMRVEYLGWTGALVGEVLARSAARKASDG